MSQPGEPIWLREGIFLIKVLSSETTGLPIGTFLKKPCRGILLDRKIHLSTAYVKAYVDNLGERYIEESEVLELKTEKIC